MTVERAQGLSPTSHLVEPTPVLHLNLGAEFGLFDILTVRGGINRGYLSLGAGIWLPFMQIDASYGWQEFGNQIGDKPVDSLTIKFSLGYDKK